MNTPKSITVLLVEDHKIVREGLKALLRADADIKVVGEADSGRHAVELMEKLHPDVVVMDIAMPGLNGIEATRQILKIAPSTRIIALSAHGDDAYVDNIVEVGASGYLVKQTSANVLPLAIREVSKGNTYFSPSILKSLTHRQRKSPDHSGV